MRKTGCARLIISDRSNYHAGTILQNITLAFTIYGISYTNMSASYFYFTDNSDLNFDNKGPVRLGWTH